MGWIYTSDYGSFPHSLRLAPASKLNDSNNSDESDIHKYTWVVFRGHLFLYKHLFSRFAACKRTCFAGERTCTPVNGIMLVFEFFFDESLEMSFPQIPQSGTPKWTNPVLNRVFQPVPCLNMGSKYVVEHINQAECSQWPSWPALLACGIQRCNLEASGYGSGNCVLRVEGSSNCLVQRIIFWEMSFYHVMYLS